MRVCMYATQVAAQCYQQVGLAVEDHMTSLSAAQVETLHHAFQQIDMYGGQQGSEYQARQKSRPPSSAASSRRPPSSGDSGSGKVQEGGDPFAAKPKVRNSFESSSGDGGGKTGGGGRREPGPDSVPGSGDQSERISNPMHGAGGGGGASGADAGSVADPFASKPKVRNSFDAGPSRHTPAPTPQPVEEPPADYSMPDGYERLDKPCTPSVCFGMLVRTFALL